MKNSARCLYNNDFKTFNNENNDSVLGFLCKNYHGNALTTTRDAWEEEIVVMKQALSHYRNDDGQIIFEYDIPRLGKRIN